MNGLTCLHLSSVSQRQTQNKMYIHCHASWDKPCKHETPCLYFLKKNSGCWYLLETLQLQCVGSWKVFCL